MAVVEHQVDQQRFVARVDEHLAQLTYDRADEVLVITHTLVPPPVEGRGIGAALVAACVDHAVGGSLTVRSRCWFADRWLDRHPDAAAQVGWTRR